MKNRTYKKNKGQLNLVYKILKKYLPHVIKPSDFYNMTEDQRKDYITDGFYVERA